jgi:hypothetical protein
MFARERVASCRDLFLGIRRYHYQASFTVAIHSGGSMLTARGIVSVPRTNQSNAGPYEKLSDV